MCFARPKASDKPATGRKTVPDRFSGHRELLAKHRVTEEELILLNTISLFGNFSVKRDLGFLLKNIRGTITTP